MSVTNDDPAKTERRRDQPLPWHATAEADVLAKLQVDAVAGLSPAEASARLERHGPNALGEPEIRSLVSVFVGQFRSPLIYLLFVAAAIALALGHVSDATVIFVVVVLNSLIGAMQEGRAERSLVALRRLETREARLVRDERHVVVAAQEVVPGDIVIVEAGDAVPADVRILDASSLRLSEATLTGESLPVEKEALTLDADTPLADRRNMMYAGTHVAAGRGRGVVVETGLDTEVGRIAKLAESAEQPQTPLERRVAQFGRYIAVASVVMLALVAGIGVLRGIGFGEILMIGISQMVGMVPEGLPVAMTIALAVGVQRMARRNAVIRRLAAVETLGSTTVICTDKTGTLTKNEMTVTTVVLAHGETLEVSGTGYEPSGEIRDSDGNVWQDESSAPRRLGAMRDLLLAGVLCNDADLQQSDAGDWRAVGDPTEVSLISLALKAGLDPTQVRERHPRRAEVPFDSGAQLMATRNDGPDGARTFVKGSPEAVLDLCTAVRHENEDAPLSDTARRQVDDAVADMAARTLRVLAIAVVEADDGTEELSVDDIKGRAILLGLVGQIDPPRAEVDEAVARCRAAGIRPVMVTGDHKTTGSAIATQLGISRDDDEALDGRDLAKLSDEDLSSRIDRISVFARVHPAQKLRIVDALQRRGEVVAMTGDGVNDAPALVKADVGVAMGRTGTEVAKEAARIVITDDNLATIVAAVEEGRVVYRNIKKVVLYLFSTAAAEVLLLFGALVIGYPPPLAAVQILWINLVTEGTVTVNLVMEPAEGDEMDQPPIPAHERLLTPMLLTRLAFMTPAICASALGWFIFRLEGGVPFPQVQTEVFTLLAVCQWFNVLNCRSHRRSALGIGLLRNTWLVVGLVASVLLQVAVVFFRPLGDVFHTVPLSLSSILAIGAVASLVLWVEEARKLVWRWSRRGEG